jgi:hypothetical protein
MTNPMSASQHPTVGLDWLTATDLPGSRVILVWVLALALLIGLPLLGALPCRYDVGTLLDFPPLPPAHPDLPFDRHAFALGAVVFAATLFALASRVWRGSPIRPRPYRRFPWWGHCSAVLLAGTWTLAWTRFDWFEPLQRHTFTPLWIGYIGVVNALTFRRVGECLLTRRPRYLLALFPLSACFWWFFEYLNRYVHNWYYMGVEVFTPVEYVAYASFAFSTVLPAVMSTAECLSTYPRLEVAGKGLPALRARRVSRAGLIALAIAGACLVGLPCWPELLFPAIWVAPGVVMLGLLAALRMSSPIAGIARGDWRPLLIPAIAGLTCGLFWELWNSRSLAHWEYAIPWVGAYHVFEMPILGYAGYLPFGVECMIVASLLPRPLTR